MKIIVFDFDGTLVDSNEIKRNSFIEIFQNSPLEENFISEILLSCDETFSRIDIISKIYFEANQKFGFKYSNIEKYKSIIRYSKITDTYVSNAKSLNGTVQILKELKKNNYKIFISSNTPIENLYKILNKRKWLHFFDDIFGYPDRKEDVVKFLISNYSIKPCELLVVGDGNSDEKSSKVNKTSFFKIINSNSLLDLRKQLLNV